MPNSVIKVSANCQAKCQQSVSKLSAKLTSLKLGCCETHAVLTPTSDYFVLISENANIALWIELVVGFLLDGTVASLFIFDGASNNIESGKNISLTNDTLLFVNDKEASLACLWFNFSQCSIKYIYHWKCQDSIYQASTRLPKISMTLGGWQRSFVVDIVQMIWLTLCWMQLWIESIRYMFWGHD